MGVTVAFGVPHRGADQEETSMAQTGQFDVPPDMRAFAEKSVEQAREAFEAFMAAAQRTVGTVEGQAETARKGAQDFGQKAMTLAERNIASSFEFAQKLVQAKDVHDVVRLQTEYLKAQIQTLNAQAHDIGQNAARMAAESVNPKR
jgi:phasin